MKKFIICCLLIVLLMGLLPCTLIASTVGDEETANACTTPAEFRVDWTIENEGTDSAGFAFEIKIYSRPKYCELDSDGNVESSEYISYDTDSKFMLNEAKTNLHCYGSDVFIDITGKSQTLSEYPDAPGMPKTVFSLLLNEETQSTVLSGLDALVTGAKLETEADAEAFMPILVQYLSASLDDIAPSKEPTPKWPIVAAICGGIAVVAAVPVSLLVIRRKRKKESASVS